MIAICAGGVRTGSIALWQVMREIVLKSGGRAPRLGTDFFDEKKLVKWAEEDNYVLIKSHEYNDVLDDLVADGRCRAVLTIRDMRDVVVSLMNFNDYGFDNAIHARAFKRNVENYYVWREKIPNSLLVWYEDFMFDRASTIMLIASYLMIDLDYIEAKAIDEKWNIEANKKRAKQKHKYESVNYMAERHIHSGAVNQWEEALTEEQIRYIEKEHGPWLIEMGYDVHCRVCGRLRPDIMFYYDGGDPNEVTCYCCDCGYDPDLCDEEE